MVGWLVGWLRSICPANVKWFVAGTMSVADGCNVVPEGCLFVAMVSLASTKLVAPR